MSVLGNVSNRARIQKKRREVEKKIQTENELKVLNKEALS